MEKLRKLLVTAGGVIYLLFGIFHNTFWIYFSKMQHVDPSFVKITKMLNLGCMVFFCSLGFIFLRYREEILTTSLGNALLILSAVFLSSGWQPSSFYLHVPLDWLLPWLLSLQFI